ncbi:MAG: enoyl-CoA hydratase-related protein, partial [Pseudomonadota bacterium]|nr:enoyl-CoA hydratase-related protein [Pseudomonadota bacterium]
MEQSVIYSVDERNIATVTLNRAEKHNAFDDEMINELTRVFKKAGEDKSVRAL